MNETLTTFPAPLLRLILCGGGGLPPAWGPLLPAGSAEPTYTLWHGSQRGPVAVSPFHHMFVPMEMPETWHLPLDASSPWPARLAMVAAWMLGRLSVSTAWWSPGNHAIILHIAVQDRLFRMVWSADDGDGAPRLPTLPPLLTKHQPVVALLLALFDVPEIRARVERS